MFHDRLTIQRTMAGMRGCLLAAAALAAAPAAAVIQTSAQQIDVRQSKLTIFVYKAGLLRAFGDDHVISAPISRGEVTVSPSPAVQFVINAADLVVLDPHLDEEQRTEIRTRMMGPDVLDTAKFPNIAFESTNIDSAAARRWTVSGRLTIRGITRALSFPVTLVDGRYRGEAKIQQRDFGIEPIRVAGGTIQVKDELKIEFDIAVSDRP
jgi:polyisoprenoid-binding protein YceI